MTADPPDPEPVRLWCRACGSCLVATVAEVSGYVRSGWPHCCGRPMGYFPPAPEANDPAG